MERIYKYLTFQSTSRSLQISLCVGQQRTELSNKLFLQHNVTYLHFINQLCNTHYSNSRTLKITITTMLKKEIRFPQINRLRIIGKYKADYNLILKLYWP